jgi:hypothetical protein
MRTLSTYFSIFALLASAAALNAAPEEEQSSVVIVFKDGHQQSFHLGEIARIEFGTGKAAAAGAGALTGRGRFQGEWKVGDGAGGTFQITLKPDGEARKTLGSSHGTWTAVNGEARISWDDGWHDIIRKAGGKYQKAAFSPGTSLTDEPSNVAEAVYTEPH